MGILVNTGFDVGSSSPIDDRTVKNTTLERDALVSDGKVYENLKVYCKDTQKEYRWTGTEWEEVGTGGSGSGTDISMTDYYTKTEVNNDFLKKTDAASTYATKTDIETISSIILDSEVRLDKTYSSSKIYSSIQDAIDTSKAYTLSELGKMSGASYKVVTATNEMTDEKIIYLLDNGTTFDMYIVDNGTSTKIGDTDVDLSDYYTKTEMDNDFLKKADADGKYATIVTVDGKVDKDKIATVLDDTVTDEQVASALLTKTELDKTNAKLGDKADKSYVDDKVKDGCVKILKNTDTDAQDALFISYKNRDFFGLRIYKNDNSEHELKFNTNGIYYVKNGVKVCGISIPNVGKTTITPASSNITGNIKYTVKNGICYVSLFDVKSKINTFGLSISTTMPIPVINCGSVITTVGNNGNIGFVYINENTTQLMADFYITDVSGKCSFSYPVAE